MKAAVLVLAALQLQAVLGGHFSVRMPFLNPAGVTYIEGPAPVGLAAGPAAYAAAPAAYAAAPAAYAAAPAAYAAAPVAPVAYAAHVKTASVGYAAVPSVHHVPAVQDVPYTRIEATPGFVQKEVDVAKPAVATRRFQIRRPAIQKQFYDIEERVVVRPAGSALVELDQPLSKSQKGATVVSHAAPVVAAPVVAAPVAYAAHAKVLAPAVAAYPALSAAPIVAAPVHQTLFPQQQEQPQYEQQQQPQYEQQQPQYEQQQQQQPQFDQQPQQPQFDQQPQQPQFDQQPQQPQFDQQPQQDDSVEVSNPDLSRSAPQQPAQPAPEAAAPQPQQAGSRAAPGRLPPLVQSRGIATPEDLLRQFASSPALRQLQAEGQALEAQRQQLQARMAQLLQQQQQQQQDAEALAARERHLAQARASQPAAQTEARFAPTPAPAARQPAPVVESRSLGAPLEGLIPSPAPRSASDVVPSLRTLSPEQSQENQQRLIQLLTAQGGVAEVGSARAGAAGSPLGDAGQVRARVLSATPAPDHAEPTNERVQTRRVVVSRPIETVQEIDVVEPFTKIHRVAVQQPALFKTAVHDVARVHTSVPVLGKTLTPYTVYH